MPILHVQFAGEAPQPDGTSVPIPPGIVLAQRGPCVEVSISVAQVVAQQLAQSGQPIPAPVSGLALIDTGASVTCVDDSIAQQIGAPVVDVVQIASASHAATQQNVYPLSMQFVGFPINVDAPRAVGAPLLAQGIAALIGRDVLQHTTFFYNGSTGQITLAV